MGRYSLLLRMYPLFFVREIQTSRYWPRSEFLSPGGALFLWIFRPSLLLLPVLRFFAGSRFLSEGCFAGTLSEDLFSKRKKKMYRFSRASWRPRLFFREAEKNSPVRGFVKEFRARKYVKIKTFLRFWNESKKERVWYSYCNALFYPLQCVYGVKMLKTY